MVKRAGNELRGDAEAVRGLPVPRADPAALLTPLSRADMPTIKYTPLLSLNRGSRCFLSALRNHQVLFKRLMIIFFPSPAACW